jgi:hypothetical protein
MWWDTLLTVLIVAAAALYVAQRLFLKPHCGPSDGCKDCKVGTEKSGTDPTQ